MSARRPARAALRAPTLDDHAEFVARAQASRALHRRWVQPPSSEAAYFAWLERMTRPENRAFFVVDAAHGAAIAGVFNVTNIVRGNLRGAYLGYYAFSGFERRGLMKAGLALVLRRAFGTLGLHRVEANIQPDNAASIALVRSAGFELEGFSPRYLKVAGRWRDHERWAKRAD